MDASNDRSAESEPDGHDDVEDRPEGYGLEPEPEPESTPEATSGVAGDPDAERSGREEGVETPTAASTPDTEEVHGGSDPEIASLLPDGAWKPWALAAAIVLGIVTIAVLAGWESLFPQQDGRFLDAEGKPVLDAPEISARFLVASRLVLTSIFLVVTVVPAMYATAFLESRPIGGLATGLARTSLGVAIAAAVRLVPLGGGLVQTWVHLGLGLFVLVGTSFLLLRLRGPSLTLTLTAWGIAYVLFGLVARLMAWGVPLF